MKKILVSLVAMMFLFAPMAFAIIIDDETAGLLDGADAGNVDTFLNATTLANAKPDTETTWVNTVLSSGTATYVVKNETVSYFKTKTSDVFAFYLGTPLVEYFLIKNSTWWALFQNLDDKLWGVFDTSDSDFPSGLNLPTDSFTISHVTRFNAVPVPEPTTLLLFGAGIAGLALYRRKTS